VIQPWDKTLLPVIEKAIQASTLGINPIADKDTIRLNLPQLTEERRKELVKFLGKFTEEARIRVRHNREDALHDAKDGSEDEKFRHKNEVQKIVDDINKKIEEIASQKEKEIMTV
jgi:ribosome recycling factor